MKPFLSILVVLTAFCGGPAFAQIDGAATQIIIPIVASTASFATELQIRDTSGLAHGVAVKFYEGATSATPGPKTCTTQMLAAWETRTVTLASICPLTAGGHFGFVILTDASPGRDKLFYGYSRTSNPQGIGFSVEGFPIGHLGGGDPWSEVPGVKRKAATPSSPAFQTNCFVAALDDPVDYSINIWAGGPHAVTGSLEPFQMHRYLDIHAAAGAPAGDYDNTPVDFNKTTPSQFPNTLIAFCTVQDNTSFGADFRIAKNWNAADPARFRADCFAATYGSGYAECVTPLQPWAPAVPNATTMVRQITRIDAPDVVNCSLVGDRVSDLEMRLVRDYPYAVVAGGSNQSSIAFDTGKRSAIGNGYQQYYWIDVGFREGGTATFPIPFGIRCISGNGMMQLRTIYNQPDEF